MKTKKRPGWGQGQPLSTGRGSRDADAQQLAEAMRNLMQNVPDSLVEDHTPAAADTLPAQPKPGTSAAGDAPEGNREQRRAQTKAQRLAWREIERRNRKQLLPHYITAALAGLALAIHEAAAHATGIAALLTALGGVAAGAVGYWVARRRKLLLEGWQMWTGTLLLSAAAWMTLAVAAGVTWGTVALALIGDYSLGARWWRRHAHGHFEAPSAQLYRGHARRGRAGPDRRLDAGAVPAAVGRVRRQERLRAARVGADRRQGLRPRHRVRAPPGPRQAGHRRGQRGDVEDRHSARSAA